MRLKFGLFVSQKFLRNSDKLGMSYAELDFYFPFVVLSYGLIVSFVLHTPALVRLAEERLDARLRQQFLAHKGLSVLCLIVGGIWSLQNIWL